MSDEYGSDFLTITDEEGNEFELEHLDTIEVDDQIYMAFLPADMDESDEDYGIVILKAYEEGEEDVLLSINDEIELNNIYERFMERFSNMDSDESEDEDENEDEDEDEDE